MLVGISGAIIIVVFIMLSLGNDAGCWRCVLDHAAMGRIWLLGGCTLKTEKRNLFFSWFCRVNVLVLAKNVSKWCDEVQQ